MKNRGVITTPRKTAVLEGRPVPGAIEHPLPKKAALSSSQNLRRTDIASGIYRELHSVIPAKAGIHFAFRRSGRRARAKWIPAFAGMTTEMTTGVTTGMTTGMAMVRDGADRL